ncbi:hypothetical protein [Halothermothrix orenii]|uniref:Uncharacterized protein n=1 Tax=Halothermothrix orenii (strain H 168 / OCM 544 / DSM 9562) TaxID=373903 RepID=B8CYZ3_HALOH|nr:hypothetical protein [Halothermothrix orenii]ACL70512.1 hypothetical protein Hore_17630 [Halothermothrix orenii H 168]
MKKITLFMFLFLFLVAVNGVSEAVVKGELVNIPTADFIADRGLVSVEADSSANRVVKGLFAIHPRLIVGGMVEFNRWNESELGVVVKTVLVDEDNNQPAVAAGIYGRDIFVVASKNLGLGFGLRGHLGLGNGELEGLYLGVSKVINPVTIEVSGENNTSTLPPLMIMGEYVNRNINVGLRLPLKEDLLLDLSAINIGSLDSGSLRAGLSYSF